MDLLGKALFNFGYYGEARNLFGWSQKLNGPHRDEQMGFWYQMRRKKRQAREAYHRAMKGRTVTEATFSNLATLEREYGDLEESDRIVNEGLEHFPDSINLNFQKAGLYWRWREWKKAIPYLEKVLAINPQHDEAIRLLKAAKFRSKKLVRADVK